jgi:hypothetical protein
MFQFAQEANTLNVILVWFVVLFALFFLNEIARRLKWVGFFLFFILPIIMTVLWFTVFRDALYDNWFHLVKIYSAVAASVGFWCIRHLKGTNKDTNKEWKLVDTKFAMLFPPLILALNILQAVVRDIQIGLTHFGNPLTFDANANTYLLGGPWNYMNALAGVFSIIAITGFAGICLKKKTKSDGSRDMIWPDMLWFYIIAYNIWNFTYTYNALPHRSWYNGLALLIAPTICAFTVGKGAWVQHRGQTLALWVMFALTFPHFLDDSMWSVTSTYNPNIYMALGIFSLLSNAALVCYVMYKWRKTKRNPYTSELFIDLSPYKKVKASAE